MSQVYTPPTQELHLGYPKGEYVENGSFNNQKNYSFCGPGTKTDQRITEGYKGVNKLDRACKYHDLYYGEIPKNLHNLSDVALAETADEIAKNVDDKNYPDNERDAAKLVSKIMKTKAAFGAGITNKKYNYNKMEKNNHLVYLSKKEYEHFLKTGTVIIKPHVEISLPLSRGEYNKIIKNSVNGKDSRIQFDANQVHSYNLHKQGGVIPFLPLLAAAIPAVGSIISSLIGRKKE